MSVESNNSVAEEQFTLENPDVVTKYQTAAVIANETLEVVLNAVKDGADIFELCKLGRRRGGVQGEFRSSGGEFRGRCAEELGR